MKLLLLSNSTNYGEDFLSFGMPMITNFLRECEGKIIFIPYAAVKISEDEYFRRVKDSFESNGLKISSIHTEHDVHDAINNATAVVVGGGNTFHLLHKMQKNNLVEIIRNKVLENKLLYIGWSAGVNVVCPSIRTTNDMPVVEPDGMDAMDLVPFQINPHFTEQIMAGHGGETREERLQEFIAINQHINVVGLREGSALVVSDKKIRLVGPKPIKLFSYGKNPQEFQPGDDINFLMNF